jgi:NhaC family Na+:H+ antiporter
MTATLGVSTFVYFPYCFFNFLNPIISLIYGFVGVNVQRLPPESKQGEQPLPQAPLVALQK